jgi:hypothetical protein
MHRTIETFVDAIAPWSNVDYFVRTGIYSQYDGANNIGYFAIRCNCGVDFADAREWITHFKATHLAVRPTLTPAQGMHMIIVDEDDDELSLELSLQVWNYIQARRAIPVLKLGSHDEHSILSHLDTYILDVITRHLLNK